MSDGKFKVKTQKEYIAECKSMGFTPLENYINVSTRIKYKCNSCTDIFVKTPMRLKTLYNQGKGCYNCWRLPKLEAKRNAGVDKLCKHKSLRVITYPNGSNTSKGTFYCESCDYSFSTTRMSLKESIHCCPKYARRNFKKATGNKPYKLGNKTVFVQGYEPQALDILIKSGWSAKEITVQSSGNIPTVNYKYQGKIRKHYPDIYIESEKLIFEVKSNASFGLNNPELFEQNKQKRKYAIKQGYKYEFIVIFQSGCTPARNGKPRKYHYTENPLVPNWWKLSFEDFVKQMKATSFYVCVGDSFYTKA